ncbi:TetR/AcrR family transcriptional regulator [Actinomadura sp. SCN-SB]|uniref:TetR/AcrR family transcriptional regulator n=1 Tax=Actinomadura sp. SCN-SB TaxID=3373092 RepID=UPI00375089E3
MGTPTRRGPGGTERERPRGRQAEAQRNDQLVLEAARAVFAEQGADAPVAAVAERAGVGMGTLYRRYGSKEELLQHLCLMSMSQSIQAAEQALSQETDGWSTVAAFVRRCVAARVGAFSSVAGTIAVTDEMTAASERGRELLDTLVQRGQADGTLRADVVPLDVSYLIEVFARLPRGTAEQDNVVQRQLALALDGLRASGQPRLPGTPPSDRHYQARWYGDTGS